MYIYIFLYVCMTYTGVSYAPFKALSQAAKEARDEVSSVLLLFIDIVQLSVVCFLCAHIYL